MSHAVALARSAREKLAEALASLQNPDAPESVLSAAAPVARCMGVLHQFETHPSDATAQEALDSVRKALSILQGTQPKHPALDAASAQVAASLGLVHSVGELTQSAHSSAKPGEKTVRIEPTAADAMDTVDHLPSSRREQMQNSIDGILQPWSSGEHPAPGLGHTQRIGDGPTSSQRMGETQRIGEKGMGRTQRMDNGSASNGAASKRAAPKQAAAAPESRKAQVEAASSPEAQEKLGRRMQPANVETLAVEAALGAHSQTNFYKGLDGNDVIDAGGLFVASYQIPEIGKPLQLKVSMPGGYEFEARGIVKWCRDAPRGVSVRPESPPGYGVRFTQISDQARELVRRYVRNREPLFHDDS